MTPQRRHVYFTVEGLARAKQRARYNPKSGKHYTPRGTVAYERAVRQAFRSAAGEQAPGVDFKEWKGTVAMSLRVFHAIPKSWPKKTRELAMLNLIACSRPPDYTNVAKAVEDALNGVAYADDAAVIPGPGCAKLFGEPHIEVWLEYTSPEPGGRCDIAWRTLTGGSLDDWASPLSDVGGSHARSTPA